MLGTDGALQQRGHRLKPRESSFWFIRWLLSTHELGEE
jgi:hypothetical protein